MTGQLMANKIMSQRIISMNVNRRPGRMSSPYPLRCIYVADPASVGSRRLLTIARVICLSRAAMHP